jgi:hypothetical protein
MAHANDVLLDDGPVVQLSSGVVRSHADQLHPALVRLVIGRAPWKAGRNEWWMLITRPAQRVQNAGESTCM